MKFPNNTKPFLWGAAAGAVALAIVGFSWGGWVTGGSAAKSAAVASHDAVVMALAPICAENFRAESDAAMNLTELKKASSWDRAAFIEHGGWALMRGAKSADSDVARACAEILTTPPTPKT